MTNETSPNDGFDPLAALEFIDSTAAKALIDRQTQGRIIDAKRKLKNWIQSQLDAENGTPSAE